MAFDGAADEALSASDAIANVENITKHLSTVPDGIKIDLFNRSIELSSKLGEPKIYYKPSDDDLSRQL